LSPEDRELLVLRVDRGLAWNDLARVLSEEDGELDGPAITREAARLRKRFQVLKDRLREMART
jgi:RNA polymerase sigma-70 factor (ECF subfamily)